MGIKLDNLKFKKIFEEYQVILEKTLPECVQINARLVAVELARRTQPFGDKDSARFSGEKAIRTDLYGGKRSWGKGKGRSGIFAPLTPRQEAYAEFMDSDDIFVHRTKDGTIYGTDKAHFLPDASSATLRGIHKGAFKNGRMSAAGADTHNIGRWKFINKYFVPGSVLSEYITAQQAKVGIAKSGWAACAKKLKTGKSAGTRGIPTWVTRHLKSRIHGAVQDNTSNQAHPHVILTNTLTWIDKVLPVTQQLEALANVGQRMKTQMFRILKARDKKALEAA